MNLFGFAKLKQIWVVFVVINKKTALFQSRFNQKPTIMK
jgi:hypothetical protein